MQLSCIGCGSYVIDAQPGKTIAISCRCGASAPILVNEGGMSLWPPFSLVKQLTSTGKVTAHIEYYLGYSDHESSLKHATVEMLRRRGATLQEECDEDRCRQAVVRGKERWERLERERRIQEIGEP